MIPSLSSRSRNAAVRCASGLALSSAFSALVWLGPAALQALTYVVLAKCYAEVTDLGLRTCGAPLSRGFAWALFGALQWFLVGQPALAAITDLDAMFVYRFHLATAFVFYVACIVYFVVKTAMAQASRDYLRHYALLAWIHVTLAFLAVPAHLINLTLRHGMIWYVAVMSTITLNDIVAYGIGYFVGRTPLIALSPKKTLEGFVGGGLTTVAVGTLAVSAMMASPHLACPTAGFFTVTKCNPQAIFSTLSPTHHSFAISFFAAFVGPFGGFIGSGLKRACDQKDFGSLIPGHGGVLDRCDCMFLMAAFAYFYLHAFVLVV